MLGLARDRLADGAGAPGRGRGSPVMSERVTVPSLQQMKHEGRKIVGVVAWDYQMARIADRAGVEIVSVGDSVGVNLWGQRNPLEVTVKQMLIAAQAVRRGVTRARPGRLARHLRRPVPRRVPAPGRVLGRPGQRADRADGPGPDPSVPRLGPLSLRLFPPAPVAAARARCGRPGPEAADGGGSAAALVPGGRAVAAGGVPHRGADDGLVRRQARAGVTGGDDRDHEPERAQHAERHDGDDLRSPAGDDLNRRPVSRDASWPKAANIDFSPGSAFCRVCSIWSRTRC